MRKALEPLPEPGRARVLHWAANRFSITGLSLAPPPPPGSGTPLVPGAQPPAGDLKIDKFVLAKRPNDTYERLACLAYYLDEREGKADVKSRDLTKANIDARQQRVSNMSNFLNLAAHRHGFFSSVGKGKKRLTSRGRAVVEALPDRQAVEQALNDHPLTGKRRAKKGKKAKS